MTVSTSGTITFRYDYRLNGRRETLTLGRNIPPVFRNLPLTEIQPEDLRTLYNKVNERTASATAVQIRDIVKQVYVHAIAHGEKVDNPADSVGPSTIATFVPKDRALSPLEIRLFVQQMESVAIYPTIKLALRLILLTLVRKSELIQATWDEVDFENKTWTIPKQRMKGRNPHVVYFCGQVAPSNTCLQHKQNAGQRCPVRRLFATRILEAAWLCRRKKWFD